MDEKAEVALERGRPMSEGDDIAREALAVLARRHLPPTPDNYRNAYNEVARATGAESSEQGVRLVSSSALPSRDEARAQEFRDAVERLKELVARLLTRCAEQIRHAEDPVELRTLLDLLGSGLMGSEAKAGAESDKTDEGRPVPAEARIRRLELELAQVREKVREDELTGVLNRRGLDDAYARESARASRHGLPLSLALLDIDDFKRVNDVHGHQAGDSALTHVSSLIRETVRPEDVIARFGGEEFLVLLPNAGLDEALDVMLRLQGALSRRPFVHHNEPVTITFSAGIAEQLPGEEKETLIDRADRALYRAKKAGKNRVFAAAEA